jgi:DNA-directed RNA polymerase specialized sigma24 family protein
MVIDLLNHKTDIIGFFPMTDGSVRTPQGDGKTPAEGNFPATSWSLVMGLQASVTQDRRRALETLCRRYWKPIHYYLRRRWSRLDRDGDDLTQAFFAWIMENEHLLERYTPERAGFRAYLKVILEGFANNENKARHALKRGGGAKILSMDQGVEPLEAFIPDPYALSPDQIFDLTLTKEMLNRAVESTRLWFSSAGRELPFQVFEASDRSGGEKPTDGELARRFGITESMVGNYKYEVRERIRSSIREELLLTVADPEQLEEEWKAFFRK